MIRLLIAIFFICHGLVHGIMFALPYSAQARADMTFNPSDSWLIGETRTVGFTFALAVTLAFAVTGAAYLWRAGWWPEMTIVAAVLSLALLLLYASPWWSVGYLISVALAILGWRAIAGAGG